MTIFATLAAAKAGFLVPKETWRFPGTERKQDSTASAEDKPTMSLLKAWTPYLLIAVERGGKMVHRSTKKERLLVIIALILEILDSLTNLLKKLMD